MKKTIKKQNRKTKKIKNRNRKTKRIGGDLGTNIVRGITRDKELSKNYYETVIKVDNADYIVRYIVPDHLLFKDPDQVFKNPEFEAFLSGTKIPKCLFTIVDDKDPRQLPIQITMFVKVQNKDDVNKYNWFALVDSGSQIIKTRKLFDYVFYAIKEKECQISNNNTNVISINKMYEKKKDCDNNKCTIVLVNGKNGAVELVDKESIYQKILFNFFIQQQAQTNIKETGFIGAIDMLSDGLVSLLR